MKRILTYGTFDLLHFGHIEILRRAKALGDYLVVAVSTDEFNAIKHKKAYHNYETRKKMLEAIRYVDLVIPESTWEQKRNDVLEYKIDEVVMGADWEGNKNFECLKNICKVTYLPRTEGISTTKIKKDLGLQEADNSINQIPVPESGKQYEEKH
jgi:glycerol-3-phosphate cytidylyltransferase